jgi:hypothetical protein
MFHFRSSRWFVIVLVVMAFATAAYAFAANITVPASNAGEGSELIGGYTVSGVTYTYSTANPSQITNVTFTIAPAATKAGVSLVTGGLLQSCTGSGVGPTYTTFNCAVSGVTVTSADRLRVVASD